jgi:hypothetical protein
MALFEIYDLTNTAEFDYQTQQPDIIFEIVDGGGGITLSEVDDHLNIDRIGGRADYVLNERGVMVKNGSVDLSDYYTKEETEEAIEDFAASMGEVTQEPTGFRYPKEIQVTYEWANQRVILTANAGFTLECWYKGQEIEDFKNLTAWTSPTHADASGSYFLHYCDGVFKFTTTPWFFDCVQIAFCQYKINNNGHYIGVRETHGLTMDYATHKHLHENIGTYLISGADLSDFTLNSSVATNRRPLISTTVVNDEDLESTINPLSVKTYTRRYITNSGVSTFRAFDVDQPEIVKVAGT